MSKDTKSKSISEEKRKRLEEKSKDLRKSGGGAFWYPDDGTNNLRVFPAKSDPESEDFWRDVYLHYISKTAFFCPIQNEDLGGESCAGCEENKKLRATGDKADKKLAQRFFASVRHLVVVDDLSQKGDDAVLRPYDMRKSSLKQILNIVLDPEYGDITDLEDGLDIKLVRKGSGFDTEYDMRTVRNNSAVRDYDEDEWIDIHVPLDEIEEFAELVLSEEDIEKLVLDATGDDEDEQSDRKKKKKKKKKKKEKPEPEPDEDDEDEDDDEPDEDDDEPDEDDDEPDEDDDEKDIEDRLKKLKKKKKKKR